MSAAADIAARIAALGIWTGPVEIAPLHGGLSNESFVVTDAGRRSVVRFGRDFPFHHVFREREAMAARAAHAAGLAPEVIHAAPGVMVCAFIDGVTYDAARVRADLARIAALLRRFHAEMPALVTGPAFMFWPFHVIRDYGHTLNAGGSRFVDAVAGYVALGNALERVQVALPIVFGHHDLLPANFIDDGDRLWLIDFEYAGFSTAMFDLAGVTANALCGREEADAFLGHYFGAAPDPAVIRAHAAMAVAALLREAMWSMVSEVHLDTPGVDYEAYTAENLARLAAALDAYQSQFGKIVP